MCLDDPGHRVHLSGSPPGGRASVDDSAPLTREGLLHPGEQAAAELRAGAARVTAARRLVSRDGTPAAK